MANNYRGNQRFAPPTSTSFNNTGGGIGARTAQGHAGQNMHGGFATTRAAADPAPWSKLGGLIATEDLAPLMEETPLFVKPPTKAVVVTVAAPSMASTTAQQSSASNPTTRFNNNVPRRALIDIPASNRTMKATVQKNNNAKNASARGPEQRIVGEMRPSIPNISITSPSNGRIDAGANQPVACPGDPASNPYAVKVALALYREYVKRCHFGSFDLRMTWRDFIDPPPGSKAYITIVKLKADGRFAGIRDDVLEKR